MIHLGGESRCMIFFFSSRRRHTRLQGDWSSDVCSSDLVSREKCGRLRTGQLRLTIVRWRNSVFRSDAAVRIITLGISECYRIVSWEKIGRASCRESVDLGGRRIIKKKKNII